MIKATNIGFSYTDIPLFTGGNFTIGRGVKAAIVGPNGAGKSTLFNLILGTHELDQGEITTVGTIAYVPQEVKYDINMDKATTVRQYIDPSSEHHDFQLEQMMSGLELKSLSLTSAPKNLSGGQKTKLALIRALLIEPDNLLLDEPTNFVDIAGKKWVMNVLSRYPHTLLLISHDIRLLDEYIGKVIALNPRAKTIEEYKGNYTKYLAIKKQQDDLLKRTIITEQKHLKQMKKSLVKMARYTSDKGVRQRTQLKKRIQKIEVNLPPLPAEIRGIRFKLLEPARVGELPIIVKNVSKRFGDNEVLSDLSFSIMRDERIAILGHNGVGKSTLIKIIMGLLEPDNGQIIRDDKLKVGYYSQEFESFDMDISVLDTIHKFSPATNESYIRPLLARFLFRANKIFQKVGSLSGGEKTRLSMAMLLVKDFNFLVLDEPTTYLDILSQRIILEALKEYRGTMLLVSHTEEFVKELRPSKALLLPENTLVDWSNDLLEKVSEV